MNDKKIVRLILVCFAGIIIGTILANTAGVMQPEAFAMFAVDQYTATGWFQQDRKQLLLYLLKQRGIQFLVLIAVGFLGNPTVILLLGLLCGGVVWGIVLSLETMRLGIHGMLLAIALFLPHGIFYALACGSFVRRREILEEAHEHYAEAVITCILLPFVFTILGILTEGILSPVLIQWIMG